MWGGASTSTAAPTPASEMQEDENVGRGDSPEGGGGVGSGKSRIGELEHAMRCTTIVVVALQLALLTPASANSPRPALRRPSVERQASLLAASGDQAGSSQAATSGIVPTAFQIINNVAGAGILTLSAGMAAGKWHWMGARHRRLHRPGHHLGVHLLPA